MLVLGIDPGSQATGYGVVRTARGRVHLVTAGVIRTSAADPMAFRLCRIFDGLTEVMRLHAPDEVAIEEVFRHKSSESALRLGHARGAALLAAAQLGYAPVGYNPMVVKQTVGAHGRADKAAVARMVGMLLGEQLALAADATDALAIAITHTRHARVERALQQVAR